MSIKTYRDALSWKSIPAVGFVTILVKTLLEEGLVGMFRLTYKNDLPKLDTVFTFDSPKLERIFAEAKDELVKDNVERLQVDRE